jgi:transposase
MTAAPDSLPADVATLQAQLLTERARHAEELAAARGEVDRARGEVERLTAIIDVLQRHRFGRRSERLDPDQLALGLEDVEQTRAAAEAAVENEEKASGRPASVRRRRINRGALPPHLPREEIVIDVADKTCVCCGALKRRIGEDVAERLDAIPAQFKVIVTRRPKYACQACAGEVVQAPAPERLIENGVPTEALVAHVLVAKYADHTPLYRQAQIYARQGVTLDRSTLADWVGRAAFVLRPVHARLLEQLKQSTKLFADETTAPVLDPGRGRTKKGQLWAYARDERPWAGRAPPGVAYVYAPDRKHARPAEHLAGFAGILQVDGYGAYEDLAERGDVALAFCWSHVRRQFYDIQAKSPAPIASEALVRIAPLYAVEADIRGRSADERREARQRRTRPLVDALRIWLEAKLAAVSGKSTIAEAIRYALSRWDGLCRFLDDGRIEIDSNVVERAIRPIATMRSLCTPLSSVCKHWKRVFVRRATRAPLSGDRGFHLVSLQVGGTDLVWRASHHLLGRQHAGLDQASDHVGADPKMFCGFRQRQPFTVLFRGSIGVNVTHASH